MVNLKIVDESGHTEVMSATGAEVLEAVLENPDYWVFVDGVFTQTGTVSVDSFDDATDVLLVPKARGGL